MPYLIGMDEAGYGPNLGPLVISGSVWRVPDEPADTELYSLLEAAICHQVEKARAGRPQRLAMADSKQLYKPGGGIGVLERGLLSALAAAGESVCDWPSLWSALKADPHQDCAAEPSLAEYNLALPVSATPEDITSGTQLLTQALAQSGVQLVTVQSRAVLPARFNHLLRSSGNKAMALSQTSLSLLADLVSPLPAEPMLVICDKHGGRNKYQQLLQTAFPDFLVEVRHEGRAESRYCWGPESTRVEVRFCTGGEAFLPAALASMACKYLRELAMRAFNEFWCGKVPGLKPTAGYPVDAKRFKREIAGVQKSLQLSDDLLWREK